MNKLTENQKKFADNYIECGNATEAAKKAGYSQKTARAIGAENLTKPNIIEYIAKRQAVIDSKKIATLKEIQEIRTAIVRGEVKDDFGFSPTQEDRLKAARDLEKTLMIKEEQEEKARLKEQARKLRIYHMDLDIVPDVYHAAIRAIRKAQYREYVFYGGRGSAKSSVIANIIIEILKNNPELHALVCRQVGVTIKDSVYSKIKWALREQDIMEEFDAKLSPLEITVKATGQKIYFRGADDPDKIKSITPEFGYIGVLWLEELDQFLGPEAVRKIEQSAIRGGDKAYIFKSFNPPKSKNNWANEYVIEIKKGKLTLHTTYEDVPPEWLGQAFLEEAEHLKQTHPEAYEHEYGGIPNGNGGNVFDYLEFKEIKDEEIKTFDRIYQGVDWGWYPDPYAFIRAYYDKARETIYLIDENGCNKTSNEVTASWIKKKKYDDYVITCDSAEKKSVQDYRDMSLPARPAEKGPGSVEYGMKWLQSKKIIIDIKRTPKAAEEFKKYEYERDKEGNIISGYPDKNNHFIDATRYAFEHFYNKGGNHA